jgi:hypothetical protein
MNDIPRVLCPACGEDMKLKSIVPDDDRKTALHFCCECGFAYRMSARAMGEVAA